MFIYLDVVLVYDESALFAGDISFFGDEFGINLFCETDFTEKMTTLLEVPELFEIETFIEFFTTTTALYFVILTASHYSYFRKTHLR